jgi:hypothetical protein
MPLDRLGDGFSSPVRFWQDFPRSVSPLPVRSVRFPAHSRIAGVSMRLLLNTVIDFHSCLLLPFLKCCIKITIYIYYHGKNAMYEWNGVLSLSV